MTRWHLTLSTCCGEARFEPRMAGWEASTLPLCYAVPHSSSMALYSPAEPILILIRSHWLAASRKGTKAENWLTLEPTTCEDSIRNVVLSFFRLFSSENCFHWNEDVLSCQCSSLFTFIIIGPLIKVSFNAVPLCVMVVLLSAYLSRL